jgi:hypothetical protein
MIIPEQQKIENIFIPPAPPTKPRGQLLRSPAEAVKGKLLQKFSLKIPFKTFHASADVAPSPAPSARISKKILRKSAKG